MNLIQFLRLKLERKRWGLVIMGAGIGILSISILKLINSLQLAYLSIILSGILYTGLGIWLSGKKEIAKMIK